MNELMGMRMEREFDVLRLQKRVASRKRYDELNDETVKGKKLMSTVGSSHVDRGVSNHWDRVRTETAGQTVSYGTNRLRAGGQIGSWPGDRWDVHERAIGHYF